MGLLDDPEAFYAPLSNDWAQGDLVLVPTAVLWAVGQRRAHGYPQPAPLPDGAATVVYELWAPSPFVQGATVECRVGPAIVITDDCEIDKDFNARVSELVSQGKPESLAIEEARADKSLDPVVQVAPVQPYSNLRYVSEQSVRTAQALGYFPIIGGKYMDAGFADLGVVTTVSRQLLRQPIVSLSEGARSLLRWKTAQTYAARNCSVDAQIQAAVGKTITGVRTVEDNKHRLVVHLELDGDSDSLILRQEPRRQELQAARTRGRPTSS